MKVGDRFGRLKVLSLRTEASGFKRVRLYWVASVECECGTIKDVLVKNLTRKTKPTRSCGCLTVEATKKRQTTHGRSKKNDRTYHCWQDMLARCRNESHRAYSRYGGRGIKVCERWLKFETFLADMGEMPPNRELDRYPDNDGDYEPSNCRWATRKEQCRNYGRNVNITVDGKTMCMAEWAETLGVSPVSIWKRINYQNMSPEEAVTKPFRKRLPLPTAVG